MVSWDFIVDGKVSFVYGEKDGTKVGRNEMIYTWFDIVIQPRVEMLMMRSSVFI